MREEPGLVSLLRPHRLLLSELECVSLACSSSATVTRSVTHMIVLSNLSPGGNLLLANSQESDELERKHDDEDNHERDHGADSAGLNP